MNTQFVTELFQEFQERKSRNNSYSERAFARAVGLSPGFLKLLFQRKKRISAARAREVAQRLSWSESKISALTQFAPSPRDYRQIAGLDFFEISDWYHFALIELLKTCEAGLKKEDIGRRLKLSSDETTYALEKLSGRGLIKSENGLFKAVADHYEVPAMSSESIRKFHRQTLTKALEALDHQDFSNREFKALTLAFDPARLKEAEKFMGKFIQAFNAEFGSGNLTAVYQLNLALFQLDQEKPR